MLFAVLILLWLFRDPRFIEGWGIIFREEDGKKYDYALVLYPIKGHMIIFVWPVEAGRFRSSHVTPHAVSVYVVIAFVCYCVRYVTDTTTVLTIVFLLFLIPSEPIFHCSTYVLIPCAHVAGV